jgi:LmbE family N-acetylglucosaminyl deacetylase
MSSSSPRPVRVAARLVESGWRALFALRGRLRPAHPAEWLSPGGQRVLVVAPHPDDDANGCGGALLRHRAAGDRVVLAWLSDGGASRAGGLTPAAMAAARRREAHAFAETMGAEPLWLGLPEGGWAPADGGAVLQPILAQCRPDVIYAPSRVDFHPEHIRAAAALARVLAYGSDPTLAIRAYAVQVPLTPALANLVADVTSLAQPLSAALAVYATQSANLARAIRLRRYAAAWHGRRGLLEEFWTMPAAAYVALHDGAHRPEGGFRGLRYQPWLDGLAFLTGRRRRQALRRLVAVATATAGAPLPAREQLGAR